MHRENIQICGLTTDNQIDKYSLKYPCREICETFELCIPNSKPNIDSVLQIYINCISTKCKIINTHCKPKIFFQSIIYLKIIYVGNLDCKSIHSSEFSQGICGVIPIETPNEKDMGMIIFIEDLIIERVSERKLILSPLFLACPDKKIPEDNISKLNNCNYKNKEEKVKDFRNEHSNINLEIDMSKDNEFYETEWK